ncbi:hypothetical protein [Coralliovum pocilloporae]|uniref:hypothetical protein n=1 Tax=Coralliovum pocilloporae TaxID=3066369 RepID=UPI0033077590
MGRMILGTFLFGWLSGLAILHSNGSYERFTNDLINDPLHGIRAVARDVTTTAEAAGRFGETKVSSAISYLFIGSALLSEVGETLQQTNRRLDQRQ